VRELRSSRGSFVLLNFWLLPGLNVSTVAAFGPELAKLAASQLEVLSVNVDDAGTLQAARALASKVSIPVLFATEEVAGIYNIVYRYCSTGAEISRFRPHSSSIKRNDRQGVSGAIDPLRLIED